MGAYRVRDKQIKFRVTEVEYNMILERYKTSKAKSLGSYLRQATIDNYIVKVDYSYFKKLAYEINKIDTNINQIIHRVKVLDTKVAYTEDIGMLKDEMHNIWRIMRIRMLKDSNR